MPSDSKKHITDDPQKERSSRPTRRHILKTTGGGAILATLPAAVTASDDKLTIPEIEGPIPSTENNQPYREVDAPDGRQYIEEEYFISGEALGEEYKTQVNIRRPVNKNRQSGVAIVEPVHESGFWSVLSTIEEYVLDANHVSTPITSSPTVLENHIKPENPSRYEDLTIPNIDGIESEILAQFGALLQTEGVPDVNSEYPILSGYSNTGAKTRTYIHVKHDEARLNGAPVYEGYFPGQTAVGTAPGPIPDLDVPVIELQGEREIVSTFDRIGDLRYRREDGENYRLYEVPGMPHVDNREEDPLFPPRAVNASCNPVIPDIDGLETDAVEVNDFPLTHEWNAAIDNLIDWVSTGDPAPKADRIETDGNTIVRDEHGNAKGGKPTPFIEVPIAAYISYSEYATEDTPVRCDMVGHRIPFTTEKLEELYGNHGGYVSEFNTRLNELVRDDWYLNLHAKELRQEAANADLF